MRLYRLQNFDIPRIDKKSCIQRTQRVLRKRPVRRRCNAAVAKNDKVRTEGSTRRETPGGAMSYVTIRLKGITRYLPRKLEAFCIVVSGRITCLIACFLRLRG